MKKYIKTQISDSDSVYGLAGPDHPPLDFESVKVMCVYFRQCRTTRAWYLHACDSLAHLYVCHIQRHLVSVVYMMWIDRMESDCNNSPLSSVLLSRFLSLSQSISNVGQS